MDKIMFNDKYGLTEAVLKGRKTMTRRIVPQKALDELQQFKDWGSTTPHFYQSDEDFLLVRSKYHYKQIVAIARPYHGIEHFIAVRKKVRVEQEDGSKPKPLDYIDTLLWLQKQKGYKNKMFVRSVLMPDHILITNTRVERLHCISPLECLKEGIIETGNGFKYSDTSSLYSTALGAYADLIDKVSGKGTWDSNPFVYVYEFELYKYFE